MQKKNKSTVKEFIQSDITKHILYESNINRFLKIGFIIIMYFIIILLALILYLLFQEFNPKDSFNVFI